jgi:hypothetical protein
MKAFYDSCDSFIQFFLSIGIDHTNQEKGTRKILFINEYTAIPEGLTIICNNYYVQFLPSLYQEQGTVWSDLTGLSYGYG